MYQICKFTTRKDTFFVCSFVQEEIENGIKESQIFESFNNKLQAITSNECSIHAEKSDMRKDKRSCLLVQKDEH